MNPNTRTIIRVTAMMGLVLLAVSCSDEPTTSGEPGTPTRGNPGLTSASLDSLGEMPSFIEIAREVPSFGGFWFNNQDQIVVALTDPADFQRVVAMIPEHLGAHRPSGGYVAMNVARPFADLARVRASLRAEVFRLTGVVSLGVKESANRVEVGITSLTVEQAVRALVRSLGIPDDAVAVVQVPVPQVLSHTLQNQHPSSAIEGGWKIGSSTGICTLGFAAFRSDGSPVFVTNSHCTPTNPGFDGGAITQPYGGGQVGSEILDPPGCWCGGVRCRNADAALISATQPLEFGKIARTTERTGTDISGGPLTIDHADPTFTIRLKKYNIFENEELQKVGRTTGWSYGNVEDTCSDYNIDGWVRLCSDRVDFASQGGDSGSPVFCWAPDGTAQLAGVVFGWQGWPYNDALMSNIHQIELDLGTLSVHAVRVDIIGPANVPPNQTRTWTSEVIGGKGPFTFAWYRDGALVSTSSSYTGNTGPWGSTFELRLDLSDALGDTSSDIRLVSVNAVCGPPIGNC